MSNAESNYQYDRRLEGGEPLDGLTVTLDPDDCARLFGLLGTLSVDSGLDSLFGELARHIGDRDEALEYTAEYVDGAIHIYTSGVNIPKKH